jgi:ADP-ribose pyrophosphatase
MSEPDRRVIYRGRKIDLALQTVTRRDGRTIDREVVLHRGAVVMLPMLDGDRICLVENHRYAVNRTLIELPAGTIDRGESPDATAPRELREETGYSAESVQRIAEWYVSPGVLNERMYLYLCERLVPGPTNHQPDESLTPIIVSWNEALCMVADGRIDDAKSMLGILIGQTHRKKT